MVDEKAGEIERKKIGKLVSLQSGYSK